MPDRIYENSLYLCTEQVNEKEQGATRSVCTRDRVKKKKRDMLVESTKITKKKNHHQWIFELPDHQYGKSLYLCICVSMYSEMQSEGNT